MRQKEVTFSYHNHSCTVPYYEYEGTKHSDQHIIISGGMHGNEINGIMMCKYLQQYLDNNDIEKTLTGKITVIPTLNVLGFQQMMRYVTVDSKDLNRSFGKTYEQTFSETYAKFLVDTFFQYATHGIDIHDAGGRTILIPHARINSCDESHCDITIHNMGRWFDSKIIMEREWNSGMLAVFANDVLHIPIMTIEVGGNQMIYNEYYDDTLRGILNIFKGLHYMPWDIEIKDRTQHYLSNRKEHISHCGWLLNLKVKLWQEVQTGELLGDIYYPLHDTTEEIIAEADGFIFSIRAGQQIPANQGMLSIIA